MSFRVGMAVWLSVLLTGAGPLDAKGCARCRLAAAWGLASEPDTFDRDVIVTIQGEVISVQDVDPEKEIVAGEYLLVNVDGQQWPVRLGPVSHLKKAGMVLEPYDEVEVTGAKIPCGKKTGLVAMELRQGEKTLKFRDAEGKRLWK
jgi:hypothetical protein